MHHKNNCLHLEFKKPLTTSGTGCTGVALELEFAGGIYFCTSVVGKTATLLVEGIHPEGDNS